jgi:regulator of sigma E protease
LSGPITIAKGRFRAIASKVSSVFGPAEHQPGVLNLASIPILMAHIVLCATEMVIRRPIPERVQAWGIQIGLAIVGGMMLLAVYNDISRLFLN